MDHSDPTFRSGEFLVFFLFFVFLFVKGLACLKTSLKQGKEILDKTLKLKTPYTNLKSKKWNAIGYACVTIFSYNVVVNNTEVPCLYLK